MFDWRWFPVCDFRNFRLRELLHRGLLGGVGSNGQCPWGRDVWDVSLWQKDFSCDGLLQEPHSGTNSVTDMLCNSILNLLRSKHIVLLWLNNWTAKRTNHSNSCIWSWMNRWWFSVYGAVAHSKSDMDWSTGGLGSLGPGQARGQSPVLMQVVWGLSSSASGWIRLDPGTAAQLHSFSTQILLRRKKWHGYNII